MTEDTMYAYLRIIKPPPEEINFAHHAVNQMNRLWNALHLSETQMHLTFQRPPKAHLVFVHAIDQM